MVSGTESLISFDKTKPSIISRQLPRLLTFAFIKAECFGGDCDYAGFLVHNGEMLLGVEFDGAGIDNLRRLLKPFGVRLLTVLPSGDPEPVSSELTEPRVPGGKMR